MIADARELVTWERELRASCEIPGHRVETGGIGRRRSAKPGRSALRTRRQVADARAIFVPRTPVVSVLKRSRWQVQFDTRTGAGVAFNEI
jgi:hypothetical protein